MAGPSVTGRPDAAVPGDPVVAQAADALVERLGTCGDPVRAARQQEYLKSSRTFYGCSVPAVRAVVRAVLDEYGILARSSLVRLVEEMWGVGVAAPFEHRVAAAELLAHRVSVLTPEDLEWLGGRIADGETWAIVDRLAVDVAGAVVEAAPETCEPVLDRWAISDELWVRRAAMLALLRSLRRSDDRWQQFCRYAEAMMDDREFFIRKAIGWVAREVAKRRPGTAGPWVERHRDAMSGVTRREATRYLSA
ncbi:MAG: DNA alkylation repair protein [Microthrixaceae bacterium]